MSESDAVGGLGMSDLGDGGGSAAIARGMIGGSLPPRKRLLAGLKQNGLWLAASSTHGTSPTSLAPACGPGGSPIQDLDAEEKSPSQTAGIGDAKGGCISCGATESSAWKRVKRNGAVQRLCNFCALMFIKNMKCPHCLVVYPDVKDPSVWVQCCQCQRLVHVGCEKKSPSTVLDANSFVCLDCSQVKNEKEHASVPPGTRTKRCVGALGVNCSARTGNCGSCATAECGARAGTCPSCAQGDCSSPCSKKPRVLREPRGKPCDGGAENAVKFDSTCDDVEAGLRRSCPNSRETAAATAAAAAALAARAAAAAKAHAAAKAATAVKAAAAAKAALDAAAVAARAEAQARIALRSSLSLEHPPINGACKPEGEVFEQRKDRSAKSDPRSKEDEALLSNVTGGSIDDEELARQLHRAINSSPRISRGLAPSCRKMSGKSGSIACPADSFSACSRAGLSSAVEPGLQSKQQLTKPRSICHKELKRIDSRVVKSELKTFDANSCPESPQLPRCSDASDTSAEELVALNPEPAESTAGTRLLDSLTVLVQDTSLAASEIVVKVEIDSGNAAATHALNQTELIVANDLSQAAAMLDEVLSSEVAAEEAVTEEYFASLQGSTSPNLKDNLSNSPPVIGDGAVAGREQQYEAAEQQTDNSSGIIQANFTSDVSSLSRAASSAQSKDPDTLGSVTIAEGQWVMYGSGDSFQSIETVNFGRANEDESSLFDESRSSLHSKGASGFEKREPWQEGMLTGIPGSEQGLASAMGTAPFS